MHISGWAHMLRALTVDDVGDADDNEHLTVRTANLKHHAPPARWPPVGGGEAPPPLPSDVQDKLLLASYRGCSTELRSTRAGRTHLSDEVLEHLAGQEVASGAAVGVGSVPASTAI